MDTDPTIVLLKKQIEEIKLLNSKLKEALKARGQEQIYIVVESLTKIESKLNDLIQNLNLFFKNYSSLINEVESIKNLLNNIYNIEINNKTYLEKIDQELKELKNKKR